MSGASSVPTSGGDLSFLAAPGALTDWRMVLGYDAARETGILTGLPATPDELAGRLGLEARAVRAVLEELAVWSIVEREGEERYGAGPAAPAETEDAVLRQHAAVIRRWAGGLTDRVRGGALPPREAPSRPPPEILLRFLAANARRLTSVVADACLERFPGAEHVLDLGGGHGEYSLELARRGLRPTMQDLPHVIAIAERDERLRTAGVELFAGDFFEQLPRGPFDLVLCAGVTHTFDGGRNRQLYRRLQPIVAPGGGLAIVTFLPRSNAVASIFAVQMLVVTSEGDTHSEEDYRRWLGDAGFASVEAKGLEDRPQALVLAAR